MNLLFKNSAITALQYGTTEGYTPLVEAINSRLAEKFNISGDDDQTIITSGGQQGIELLCKSVRVFGDYV